MMNWYGGGMGASGVLWLLMTLFWIGLVALVVYLVVKLLPGSSRPPSAPAGGPGLPPGVPPAPPETPEQILDRLFALGEIDEQTYRARRTALTEMRKSS